MNKESIDEAMSRVEAKFNKYEFPPALLPAVRKSMEQQPEHFFHIPFEVEVHSKYVYGELGFGWDKAAKQHELVTFGLSLEKDKNNRLDSNIFPQLYPSEVSVTEAFNLMQGRPVYRPMPPGGEGSFWLTLDPKDQRQGIGTPLLSRSMLEVEKELERTPLTISMTPEHKKFVIATIQRGDRYGFEFNSQGKKHPLTLEANPGENRLDLRNEKGKRIDWEDLKEKHEVSQEIQPKGHRIK